MARLSYPSAGEPRPAALPPESRTVGQLVAESIRIYGEHFVRCLAIGIPAAVLTVAGTHVSRRLSLVLTPTLYGALLSASYVYASTIVLDRRPSRRRLATAWAAGWQTWTNRIGAVVYCPTFFPAPLTPEIGGQWMTAKEPGKEWQLGYAWLEHDQLVHVIFEGYPTARWPPWTPHPGKKLPLAGLPRLPDAPQ